jgi:hypothetical protein
MPVFRQLLWIAVLIGGTPASADWRPTGGLTGFVAPHLSLPVTAMGGKSLGLGGGTRLGLGWQSADAARFTTLRLTTDGFSGDREQGGDLFAYGVAIAAGTEIVASRRWSLASWGGLGWNMASGPGGQAFDGLEASAGFAVLRRARMRHLHVGLELSGAWLFAPEGLVIRIGPVVRWRR